MLRLARRGSSAPVSTKHIRSIADFLRFRIDVAVECYCGHKNTLPFRDVVRVFHVKQWPYGLDSALGRFKCSRCGSSARHIGPHYR